MIGKYAWNVVVAVQRVCSEIPSPPPPVRHSLMGSIFMFFNYNMKTMPDIHSEVR